MSVESTYEKSFISARMESLTGEANVIKGAGVQRTINDLISIHRDKTKAY